MGDKTRERTASAQWHSVSCWFGSRRRLRVRGGKAIG